MIILLLSNNLLFILISCSKWLLSNNLAIFFAVLASLNIPLKFILLSLSLVIVNSIDFFGILISGSSIFLGTTSCLSLSINI